MNELHGVRFSIAIYFPYQTFFSTKGYTTPKKISNTKANWVELNQHKPYQTFIYMYIYIPVLK